MSNISAYSIILPLSVCIFYFRTFNRALKIFSALIFISTLSEAISFYLAKHRMNNIPGLHIYTIVEFSLFILFYRELFANRSIGRYLYLVGGLFICLAVFCTWYFGLNTFNTITRSTEALMLTVIGLTFFFILLRSDQYIKIEKHPYFWINSGVLLYFMGNFFLFMLYDIMNNLFSYKVANEFWNIHSILNVLGNILFTIGLLCKTRTQI